jgi:hypothetical protein
MPGKKPIKVYQYEDTGKYVRNFASLSDCRAVLWPEIKGKKPILVLERLGLRYSKTPTGGYVFEQRVPRDTIQHIRRIENSIYCSKVITDREKIIQVFNLEGTLLLEARNINVLVKMTGVDDVTVLNQLAGKGPMKSKSSGFFYKYKEQQNGSENQ